MKKLTPSHHIKLTFCIIFLLFCELFFFRNVLTSHLLFGDNGDGRLTMLFAEHWHHVFTGRDRILDLGIFYPATHTLAYSDMFFTFGVIHTLFRLFGIEIYTAFKLTLLVVHVFGTFSLFYLLRHTLKLSRYWSLFGALAFSTSSTYALHIAHTQLMAFSLIPTLFIFFMNTCQHFHYRLKRDLYALASIICYGFILYTSWYTAFFIALFSATAFLIVSIHYVSYLLRRHQFPQQWRLFVTWLRRNLADVSVFMLILACIILPFVYAELPILQMSGGYKFQDNLYNTPEVIDLINVSEQNFMLGKIITRIRLLERDLSFEVQTGFSLVLLSTFCIVSIMTFHALQPKKRRFHLLIPLIIALFFNLLLCLQLSSNGVSLWYFIYKLVPGGQSIRAIGRYLFFLSLPMSILTAVLANKLRLLQRQIWWKIGLLSLLFISNIRHGGATARWEKSDGVNPPQLQEPPHQCQSFYIENVINPDQSPPLHQLDAYQISDYFDIPTINGYSGLTPPNYNQVWNVTSNAYPTAIYEWIKLHDLQNVCAYDEQKNLWRPWDLTNYLSTHIDASTGQLTGIASGVWDWEPTDNYSWTKKEVEVILQDQKITQQGLDIQLASATSRYQLQTPGVVPKISVYINDQYIQDLPAVADINIYHLDVTPTPDDIYKIAIQTNVYFNPKQIGENEDSRDLSLQLYYIGAPKPDKGE